MPICNILWQMVSHWGRCYGLLLSNGRCYSHVADGIATFRVDLFQFKFWDVEQNLIPHVRQMVFAYVLVEGWTIQAYVHCFFDSSDQVLVLPLHYTKVFNGGTMTSDVKMVINWGGSLQMFPEPFTKCSWWLPCILLITLHPIAFVCVDYATLLFDGVFISGSHQEAFDGITSFTIHLYPMSSAYISQALTKPFNIWNHHVGPLIARCSICIGVFVPFVMVLIWGCIDLHFHSV